MKIYLIRHGMTPGNMEHRYVGRTDEAMTEEAVSELKKKKDKFPSMNRVICSPMRRCRETAEVLFPYQDAEIQPGLEEMEFGAFEYKNYKELSGNPWIDSNGTLPFPSGEDMQHFKRRCRERFSECMWKLKSVSGRYEDFCVAFVVHGGTIMSILEAFAQERKGYYEWQVKNGCGYAADVEYENGTVVLTNLRYIEL